MDTQGGSVRSKPLLQHRANALACRAVSTNPTATHLAQHLQRVVGDKGLPPQLINRVAAHGGQVASSVLRSAGVRRAASRGNRGLLAQLIKCRTCERLSKCHRLDCMPATTTRSTEQEQAALQAMPSPSSPADAVQSDAAGKGVVGVGDRILVPAGGDRTWWTAGLG